MVSVYSAVRSESLYNTDTSRPQRVKILNTATAESIKCYRFLYNNRTNKTPAEIKSYIRCTDSSLKRKSQWLSSIAVVRASISWRLCRLISNVIAQFRTKCLFCMKHSQSLGTKYSRAILTEDRVHSISVQPITERERHVVQNSC